MSDLKDCHSIGISLKLGAMMYKIFPCGPLETNTIFIGCEKTHKAAVIDPALGSKAFVLKESLKGSFEIEKILLTHSHFDHIADVASLKKELNIPIYVHKKDSPNVKEPGSDGIPLFFHIEPAVPDFFLEDGERLNIGDLMFTVIHTPGHSPGCVCFYFEQENLLISGDTLFKGSFGTLNLPTAKADLMWTSLKKLSKLPKNTQVIPGHGPMTTIGQEPWLSRAEEYFSH